MFKRMRKFYRNNRIYCILMIISTLCILVMGACVAVYFANQLSTSNYGNRLENIDEYDLGDSLKTLEDFYNSQEGVTKTVVRTQGKILIIRIDVNEETKDEAIQNMATSSLELISEENRSYYDMQFIVTKGEYQTLMGSKNANATVITWGNYIFDNEDETTITTTAKK